MGSKRLRVKRILLVFALVGIMTASVTVAQATPTYNLSTVYTLFNTVTPAEMDVVGSANYTAPYKLTILFDLVFNETTSNPTATLGFRNASDEGATGEAFEVRFYETFALWLNVGTVDSMVDGVIQTEFTVGTEIELRVAVDGVTVYNGTDTTTHYFVTYDVNGLWTEGKVDAFTGGAMHTEFSDGGEFGLDIITEMLPVIVTIAILGVIMKQFGKFKT